MPQRERRPSVFSEFFGGVGLLFRGLRVWGTAPRLMWLGMIPALLVGALYIAGVVVLGVNLERIAEFLTPFAASWDEPFRTGTRILAGLATLAGAVLIVVYAYTSITLLVGQVFYERIWRHVERRFGDVPESPLPFWRAFWRSLGSGIALLIPTLLLGVVLFALGFIPIVGQIVVVLLGAFVGGWFLALELTGLAFEGRGMSLRERRAVLRGRRARTVGLGAAAYVSFLIPLGAVIMMPAAVAGATLLARSALGESITTATPAPSEPARIEPEPRG